MSPDAFSGFIEDTYAPLVASGALAAPYNPANELKIFQEALGLDREGATRELTAADTFAKGLVNQLKGIPETMKEQVSQYLIGMTDDAAGNVLLKALSGRLSESGFRIVKVKVGSLVL
ncbi:MAG: hypothetical protein U5K75_08560 [Ahrensia sp.]|nr:hypothetical protein [Ahrensia sp.]